MLAGLKRSTRTYASQWEMLFCASGAEALQIIESSNVNVLVTDMRMPGMDGAELIEAVSIQWPGLYRFALSGEADTALSARIVGLSHRFFSKRCALEVIHQSIQRPLNLVAESPDF
ncbi:MAG: response regulator [Candidatus Devosia symbiotica]|nr:response regulator [Candidatus Devosia symbiotica]